MFWCLVRLSTGALCGGLYANPLEMAIQSAVACSEAKDDGLLVSCQLMERVLVWVVSFSLAVEDGFLFMTWLRTAGNEPRTSCSRGARLATRLPRRSRTLRSQGNELMLTLLHLLGPGPHRSPLLLPFLCLPPSSPCIR